ncbi:MAG: hypothetical protein VX938_11260, partial [Myxococcota bacterium]|nr:hypothetical protein [Myxococcota bacterium]
MMTAPRDAKLNQASKMPPIVISLAALLAGVGGGWYFAGGLKPGAEKTRARTAETEPPATGLSEVPADLKLTPDSVTGAVMLVSDGLEREPEKIVGVVVKAFTDGRLKMRPEEDNLRGAPLPAASIAPALQEGQGEMAVGTFEAVTLAGALLRGRGVGEPVYGVDKGSDGGTNILLRRYLVRVGEDPWLAVDDQPVTQEAVRQLSAEELLADALALDALSAMLRDDTRRASRASLQARALAPQDLAIRFTVGVIEVASDLVDKGLGTMESAARDAADAESWITLGVTAMQVGQPFKAQRFLSEAATIDPKMAKPHVAMAQLALERLDLTPRAKQSEVIEQIKGYVSAAAERDPNAEGIAVIKAQLAVMADKPEEAEALLRAAVKQRQRDPVAWANLAQFLSIHGRQKEALEALEEASDYGVPGVEIQRQLA